MRRVGSYHSCARCRADSAASTIAWLNRGEGMKPGFAGAFGVTSAKSRSSLPAARARAIMRQLLSLQSPKPSRSTALASRGTYADWKRGIDS